MSLGVRLMSRPPLDSRAEEVQPRVDPASRQGEGAGAEVSAATAAAGAPLPSKVPGGKAWPGLSEHVLVRCGTPRHLDAKEPQQENRFPKCVSRLKL